MATSPGEAAYEKWCSCANEPWLKRIRELSLKPWDKLPPRVKSIWEAVAKAAIEQAKEK